VKSAAILISRRIYRGRSTGSLHIRMRRAGGRYEENESIKG
jgi:hypothetical protein